MAILMNVLNKTRFYHLRYSFKNFLQDFSLHIPAILLEKTHINWKIEKFYVNTHTLRNLLLLHYAILFLLFDVFSAEHKIK